MSSLRPSRSSIQVSNLSLVLLLTSGIAVGLGADSGVNSGEWIHLFNGTNLSGWRIGENPSSFSVQNGILVANGPRAHAYYSGPEGNASFSNFYFKTEVMTTPGANSGIYFHTHYLAVGWPNSGYEAQINQTHSDPKKTGGLYDVQDNYASVARDNEWFDCGILVYGKRIVLKIDGQTITDYTEPPRLNRPWRQLSQGTFAIQSHHAGNPVFFRNMMVQTVPESGTIVLAQPQDLFVNIGDTTEFSVVAKSVFPLHYQWLFNGAPLPAETNASLTRLNIQIDDAGLYAVVVLNTVGSVTSSNAWLEVNQYPVADASRTHLEWISPNGSNALVALDGSLSFDPDEDLLTYEWYSRLDAGVSMQIATGVVGAVTLPVGIHMVELVVDDGMAPDTNAVTLTVLTTAEAVQTLIDRVNASGVQHKQPLLATLEAALASIQRDNCHSAVGQLGAIQNKVRAQVTDANLALPYVQSAAQVIAALDCDGSPHLAARIHSLKFHANGRMHLKIKGEAGKTYVLEASTNLVNWEAICVVRPDEAGNCGYEDAVAPQHQSRFYRVVEP